MASALAGTKAEKILHFESRQKNRDGQTCPTEVVANHFEYQGVEYSCTLIRNITERKIMEEALAESRTLQSVHGHPACRHFYQGRQ